jgi:methyl-accepting chemotaxis protein
MKWFDNLKIASKLIVCFSVVLLLACFLGIFSVMNLGNVNSSANEIKVNWLPSIVVLSKIDNAMNNFRRSELQHVLSATKADMQKYESMMDDSKKSIASNLDKYKEIITSDKERQLYDNIVKSLEEYFEHNREIVQLSNQNRNDEAKAISREASKATFDVITKNLKEDIELNNSGAENEAENGARIYSSSKSAIFIALGLSVLLGIIIAVWVSRKISRPLIKLADTARRLAAGEVDVEISSDRTADEVGDLNEAFGLMVDGTKEQVAVADKVSNGDLTSTVRIRSAKDVLGQSLAKVTESLKALSAETEYLTKASVEGKLSVRGNSDKFSGAYKEVVLGINSTLDAVIGPLNMAAEYVDRISKGHVPEKITDKYNGDFNEIKNNLNGCIDAINLLIIDANMLAKASVEGKLSVRADAAKHQGDFRRIIEGVNNTLDSVIGPLNMAAEYVDRIAKGAVPEKITDNYNGDFNEIKNNLNTCIDAINALIEDANMLSKSAIEGKLSVRANATRHQGDFRKIIEGVNDTLDSVIGPLNMAAEYVDRISKGDMPAKITDNYNGDFNEIKINLNTCIDAIRLLIEDTNSLSKSAIEGKLSVRADASKHQGDFKRIIEGVNYTLDSVIGPLNMAAEYVDRIAKGDIPSKITDNYNGDFNEIKNNLNTCIDAIKLLITDVNLLAGSAVEGKLNTRAEASRHFGDFRRIIEGMNGTLDAVVTPLKIASSYIENMSKKNLVITIKEEFKGDFNELKENLNQTIESIQLLIEDGNMLATAAIDGNLSVRADISRHVGEYRKIINGFNKTIDALLAPVTEGVATLEKMAQGDLTNRIVSDFKGDHQQIKNSINMVADSLSKALSDVSEAIGATASASSQISSSTEEMAAGANEQTRQTTEVAGGVEEMTRTILENTKNVSLAAETAKDAGHKAKEGGKVVNETIEGMNKIAEVVRKSAETVQELGKSSDQIGEIVQVIDDIADQTNLLALNAAIEAARAGEQGRGFAVVADEVRKLAERTTKATKEIATMIRQIQKDTSNAVISMNEGTNEVEKGKSLANKAGESLEEIIKGAEKVVDIVTQVAVASEQQSTAAEQISKNIEAISTVTQESASGTQQIARAAEDLNKLTLNLEELINQFKIENSAKLDVEKHKAKALYSGKRAAFLN